MSTAKNILVATDFSDISAHAAIYAMDLARVTDARVTFLYVFEVATYSFMDGSSVATTELATRVSAAADVAMATLLASHESSGIAVNGIVGVGRAADEVKRVAEEIHADLIVVGTHGRRGLTRAFLGSVAELVVRTSTQPVLVVPRP